MLEIRNLRKAFGPLQVLKGIDLDVNKGDVVAILGSSGSGKTTMLRCLNFLERAAAGTMDFARHVANRVVFMEQGVIVEQNTAEAFFNDPQQPRTQEFLQTYKQRSLL